MRIKMHLIGKKLMILIGVGSLLMGCDAGYGDKTTVSLPPKATNGELAYTEVALLESDVVEKLKVNGVELANDPAGKYINLNAVTPSFYTLPSNEKIYIYVYKNSKEAIKARNDFGKQTATRNMKMPIFYGIKNVLILYSHNISGEQPQQKTAYHAKIETTSEQLLGDEIYNEHGKIYNVAKMESFQISFNNHQSDQLKVTSLTVEGDRIYTYLLTDGTKLLYLYDNSEDAFAGSDKGVRKTECTKIEKKALDGDHTSYMATGCQNGEQSYILSINNK